MFSKTIKTILLLGSLFSSGAFALEGPSNPAIKADMQAILTAVKALSQQLGDRTMNSSSLEMVQTVLEKASAAMAELPVRADTDRLQGPAREAFVSGYKAQMQLLVDKFTQIQTALQGSDNTVATSRFNEVSPIKIEGHTKYK